MKWGLSNTQHVYMHEYDDLIFSKLIIWQIKVIDPSKKTCETFLGTGKPGGLSSEEGSVQFDEPGGLCVSPDGQFLYVADTNNHAIRAIDVKTKTVSQVWGPWSMCVDKLLFYM